MPEIAYDVSTEDLVAFSVYHATVRRRGGHQRLRFTLLCALGALAMVLALSFAVGHEPAVLWISIPVTLLVSVALSLLYPVWMRWCVTISSTSLLSGPNPGLKGGHTLAVRPDGLEEITEVGRQTIPWNCVSVPVESDSHVFVYVGTAQAAVVPKAAVRGDLEPFLESVRRHACDGEHSSTPT